MAHKLVTFTGNNGPGTIAVPGVKAGDQILAVMFITGSPGTSQTSQFGAFILVNGEILQSYSGDFSIYTFAALLERKVMLP